jgi:hypothetical protein
MHATKGDNGERLGNQVTSYMRHDYLQESATRWKSAAPFFT